MKIVGIIPSRYASLRCPGKPLIDFKGKSMIRRVYERVSQSKLVDAVIVATDDQRIFYLRASCTKSFLREINRWKPLFVFIGK